MANHKRRRRRQRVGRDLQRADATKYALRWNTTQRLISKAQNAGLAVNTNVYNRIQDNFNKLAQYQRLGVDPRFIIDLEAENKKLMRNLLYMPRDEGSELDFSQEESSYEPEVVDSVREDLGQRFEDADARGSMIDVDPQTLVPAGTPVADPVVDAQEFVPTAQTPVPTGTPVQTVVPFLEEDDAEELPRASVTVAPTPKPVNPFAAEESPIPDYDSITFENVGEEEKDDEPYFGSGAESGYEGEASYLEPERENMEKIQKIKSELAALKEGNQNLMGMFRYYSQGLDDSLQGAIDDSLQSSNPSQFGMGQVVQEHNAALYSPYDLGPDFTAGQEQMRELMSDMSAPSRESSTNPNFNLATPKGFVDSSEDGAIRASLMVDSIIDAATLQPQSLEDKINQSIDDQEREDEEPGTSLRRETIEKDLGLTDEDFKKPPIDYSEPVRRSERTTKGVPPSRLIEE